MTIKLNITRFVQNDINLQHIAKCNFDGRPSFFFRPLTQIQLFVLPQVHLLPLEVLFDIKVCNTPNWYFLSTSTFIFPAGKRMLYFFFSGLSQHHFTPIRKMVYPGSTRRDPIIIIASIEVFSQKLIQFLWISSTRVESLFIKVTVAYAILLHKSTRTQSHNCDCAISLS